MVLQARQRHRQRRRTVVEGQARRRPMVLQAQLLNTRLANSYALGAGDVQTQPSCH